MCSCAGKPKNAVQNSFGIRQSCFFRFFLSDSVDCATQLSRIIKNAETIRKTPTLLCPGGFPHRPLTCLIRFPSLVRRTPVGERNPKQSGSPGTRQAKHSFFRAKVEDSFWWLEFPCVFISSTWISVIPFSL